MCCNDACHIHSAFSNSSSSASFHTFTTSTRVPTQTGIYSSTTPTCNCWGMIEVALQTPGNAPYRGFPLWGWGPPGGPVAVCAPGPYIICLETPSSYLCDRWFPQWGNTWMRETTSRGYAVRRLGGGLTHVPELAIGPARLLPLLSPTGAQLLSVWVEPTGRSRH